MPLKFLLSALLLLALTACSGGAFLPEAPAPLPTSAAPPPVSLTQTATRPPLPSSESGGDTPSVAPSATPDPAVVPETFTSPTGIFSFRYPAGWAVTDSTIGSEVLVYASGDTAGVTSAFALNLGNVGGPLRAEDLQVVADALIANVSGGLIAPTPPEFRTEGDYLIATFLDTGQSPALQYEIRFVSRDPYSIALMLVSPLANWNETAPVLDAIARSVSLNTESSTPLPTATTATGRLTEGLALEHATLYTASTGSVYIVGEVTNSSTQAYEGVRAQIELLDGSGAVVATQTWNIERDLLPAGESSPIVAIFTPAPPNVTDYRATLSALPPSLYGDILTTQFEVRGVVGSQPAFAAYALRGQVVNLGVAAQNISIYVALYDAAGNVLAVGNTTVETPTLQTNEQTEFLLTIYSMAEGEVAHQEFWVEGTKVQ